MADEPMTETTTIVSQDKPVAVPFKFVRSTQYRQIHTDGAFGGVTGRGMVHLSFYSEYQPLPSRIVHTILDDSTIGPEDRSQRVSDTDIVRELEFGVFMTIDVARGVRDWLSRRIAAVDANAAKAGEPK